MKKGIFAIFTVLAILAMVMTGCPTDGGGGGGGDTLYTVKFDKNGGSGTAPADITQASKGAAIKLPAATLTLANKLFNGWSTGTDGKSPMAAGTDYTPKGNITLYAAWKDKPADGLAVTITFNLDGGTAATAPTLTGKKTGDTIQVSELPTTGFTKSGFSFDGWSLTLGGAKITAPFKVEDTTVTLYAVWVTGGVVDNTLIEEIELANASQALYRFDLPAGKTYADYEEKISAEYYVPDDGDPTADDYVDLFEVSNSGRAIRIYGNYAMNFLQFNQTTAGNKFYYASINGTANNNGYLLTNGGGWKSLKAALVELLGENPGPNVWFTIEYPIDGTKKDNSYNSAHLPSANTENYFIFGLGLAGQDTANRFWIKNVKLVGKDGTDDLYGVPLFINKDGARIPAFSAYGNASGDGVDLIKRRAINGTYPAAYEPVAPPTVTVRFDLNTGTPADATAVFDPAGSGGDKTLTKTQQIGNLPVAKRTNYNFVGWATTATGTSPIATTQTFDADATLYAIWTLDQAEGSPVAVTLNASAITAKGNADVVDQDDGYKLTYNQTVSNSEYGNVHAWFTLDLATLLGSDKTIADVKAITFSFTPIGGDLNSKGISIIGSTDQHGYKGDTDIAAEVITTEQNTGTVTANTAQSIRLTINQSAANKAGPNYSIRIHTSKEGLVGSSDGSTKVPTSYSITSIQLIPFATP